MSEHKYHVGQAVEFFPQRGVEHTAKGFRFWIDGVAQAVPSNWNRHNDTTHIMTFGIGTFVARADTKDTWFGPPPNPASGPYYAQVAYVAATIQQSYGGSTELVKR